MKIAYILTAPQMAGFLYGHISAMKNSGFRPIIFAPEATEEMRRFANTQGAELCIAKIRRDISPWHDFVSVVRLMQLLWNIKPDITVTIGPKAGLLGGIAAICTGVPCRIQTKWGIRLETTRGLLRIILTLADQLASACAHIILCDSESGRRRTIELGLASPEKVKVIAQGSSKGIDIAQFQLNQATLVAASQLRSKIGASNHTPIVGFIGRLNQDKGLNELTLAWLQIKVLCPDAVLLVVGPDECENTYERQMLQKLKGLADVKILGEVKNILPIYAVINVLLMPTHREGFPNVVLEASAFSIPTIGFRVTGMVDAVVSGETGALVDFGDTNNLAKKTAAYLNDAELRKKHGENARARAVQSFKPSTVWHGYFNTFRELAEANDLPAQHLKWHLDS